MSPLRTCIISLLFGGTLAACTSTSATLPRTYALAQRDADGHAYVVTETRFHGADANFAVLKLWRAAAGERAPLLQLTLDDWCGSPIAWQLAPDGIVVPGTPAAARRDPENPDKCAAQPTRAYLLRGDQVVIEER